MNLQRQETTFVPTADSTDQGRLSLVDLSRRLGDPAADLAILGEGNTSVDVGDGQFLVKASGISLAGAASDSFVQLDRERVLALVDDPRLSDHDVTALGLELAKAGTGADGGKLPSIETVLHALALDLPGVRFAGHTHPTEVNKVLCSSRADALVAGPLFPDQVIVCGRHSLLVPYGDPGLPVARLFRDGLRRHVAEHGSPPKLVYLGNHGIVAMGGSATEVLNITAMAVKAARVLHGVLSIGDPRYLPPASADRLDVRPDEIHRRAMLAGSATTSEPSA
jgi:rhamnose utilization protein RhaD (predicted bifunctional aldolase and dehydrogenase)